MRLLSTILIVIFMPLISSAKGIGLELGVGYPNVSISTDTAKAKYSGVAVQGNFLLPFYEKGLFTAEFDLSYKYTSLTNNASNAVQAEWARFDGFGVGFRMNYSYFFLGLDYLFMNGENINAGTVTEIFDYSYNPFQVHLGVAFPFSQAASIVAGYSQMLASDVTTAGQSLTIDEGTVWIRIQIDFGMSFISLGGKNESFAPTKSNVFY